MKGASFTSFRLIVSQINYNGMLLKLTTKQKIALQSKNKFFHLYKLDTDSENVLLGIICLYMKHLVQHYIIRIVIKVGYEEYADFKSFKEISKTS